MGLDDFFIENDGFYDMSSAISQRHSEYDS